MGSAARLVLVMASRNVLAYRRRSLQTFIVVAVGVFVMALADAFMNGFGDRMVTGFAVGGGHLRVTAPGYAEREATCPLDRLLPGPGAVAEDAGRAAEAALPARGRRPYARVAAVPLLRAPCVVQAGDRGVDLYAAGLSAWLPGDGLAPPFRTARLVAGRWAESGERGAVLSAKEAGRLGIAPGDSVILLASDAWGSFGAVELPLLGVCASPPSAGSCLIDPDAMRELLGVGDAASELALYLVDESGNPVDPRSAAVGVAAMAAAVRSAGFVAEPWDADTRLVAPLLDFLDLFIYAIYAIFAVVAGAGIANSVQLSVQDRIRDFGTLRAVAFTARRVQAIVALETLLIGLAASLAAAGLAALAVLLIGPGGLPIPASSRGIAEWMPETVAARLDLAGLAFVVGGGSLMPLIASLWPLRLLRKMKVREALAYI